MNRRSLARCTGTVAAALALTFPAAAPAGTATSVIPVSAAVQPSAVIRFETKTAGVAVTQEDIAAGYVDVPASSILSLKTEGAAPLVVVEFMPLEGVFRSVDIVATDLGDAAAGASSAARQPRSAARPARRKVAALSYRFNLSRKAAPGVYAAPISVRVDL